MTRLGWVALVVFLTTLVLFCRGTVWLGETMADRQSPCLSDNAAGGSC